VKKIMKIVQHMPKLL